MFLERALVGGKCSCGKGIKAVLQDKCKELCSKELPVCPDFRVL